MKKALLINAIINKEDIKEAVEEIYNLCASVEIEIVTEITQEIKSVNKKTYIGSGKVNEIANYLLHGEYDCVITNFDLSPLQYTTLSEKFKIELIDRTGVILQIFAHRANTKEARLQVEMATLEYLKSRLVSKEANFSQVTSGGGGGLKNKGAGEKQIDIDRFKFRSILKRKNDELKTLATQREQTRKNRGNYPVVAIVGYTNAGKSTLMNQYLNVTKVQDKKKVLEENRLFATLETSTRFIDLKDYPSFLLTDTVGFINNLPTMLVKAFRSTLEEIKYADILLHVVDVSDPNYLEHQQVTEETLKAIGVSGIPTLYLYNKVDLVKKLPFIPRENELLTSLKNSEDIEDITKLIFSVLAKKWTHVKKTLPYSVNIFEIKKQGYITSLFECEDGYEIEGYFSNQFDI